MSANREFKRYHLQGMIDSLAKDQDATREYFEFLFNVMRGKVKVRRMVRAPGPDEDIASVALIPLVDEIPTIKEMMDAGKEINRYYNGNAPTNIEVTHSGSVRHERDLSTYTDAELVDLERLLSKSEMIEGVAVPAPIVQDALPEGVSEAELIEDKE